jgi:hypothetical protein
MERNARGGEGKGSGKVPSDAQEEGWAGLAPDSKGLLGVSEGEARSQEVGGQGKPLRANRRETDESNPVTRTGRPPSRGEDPRAGGLPV